VKGGLRLEKLYAGIAMEDVIQNFSDTLIRIAFQNTKSISDSEDIVQDVYIKLLKHNASFETLEHLKAWLIRVTINQTKDFLKTAWYRKIIPLNDSMDFFAPEEQVVMDEIFELNKKDRTIIYLYYYEGYSIDEIGRLMQKNANTISSRLQRARKKLKPIILEGRA